MAQFRERAKVVDAVQWDGKNDEAVTKLVGVEVQRRSNPDTLVFANPGTVPGIVPVGFYVLKMASGHLGVMSAAEFAMVYEGEDKRTSGESPADAGESKSLKKLVASLESKLAEMAEDHKSAMGALRKQLDDLESQLTKPDADA